MTPQEQAKVFLAMMLCGACLSAVYDLLGPLRRNAGWCAVTDMVFGLCCAAGMILTALFLQCDVFRLYVFAGAGLGLALYGTTMGAAFRWMGRNVHRKIRKREEK